MPGDGDGKRGEEISARHSHGHMDDIVAMRGGGGGEEEEEGGRTGDQESEGEGMQVERNDTGFRLDSKGLA